MNKEAVFQALKAGDRRSIGRSNQVVSIMRRQPALFSALIDGMYHDDELVRMRAADAAEKLTITNPQWIRPFKRRLISLARRVEQQELRWHLAQMLPRLELSQQDRMVVASILRGYLKDNSRIVKTFAMQGLADLAGQDSRLLAQVRRVISTLVRTGSPAMKGRGRKLLLQLGHPTLPRNTPEASPSASK